MHQKSGPDHFRLEDFCKLLVNFVKNNYQVGNASIYPSPPFCPNQPEIRTLARRENWSLKARIQPCYIPVLNLVRKCWYLQVAVYENNPNVSLYPVPLLITPAVPVCLPTISSPRMRCKSQIRSEHLLLSRKVEGSEKEYDGVISRCVWWLPGLWWEF